MRRQPPRRGEDTPTTIRCTRIKHVESFEDLVRRDRRREHIGLAAIDHAPAQVWRTIATYYWLRMIGEHLRSWATRVSAPRRVYRPVVISCASCSSRPLVLRVSTKSRGCRRDDRKATVRPCRRRRCRSAAMACDVCRRTPSSADSPSRASDRSAAGRRQCRQRRGLAASSKYQPRRYFAWIDRTVWGVQHGSAKKSPPAGRLQAGCPGQCCVSPTSRLQRRSLASRQSRLPCRGCRVGKRESN